MDHLLDFCSGCPIASFEEGEAVIEENHKDNILYVLRKGAVVVRRRDVEINRLSSPGSIFGEVGIMLNQPHGATVEAIEPSEFYRIDDGAKFFAEQPAMVLLVARILALRLRNVTDELVQFRELIDSDEDTAGKFSSVMKALVDHHLDREY
jgi:CRP/FNR family cyclic AMP-dependent transcriptional regulator